MEGFPTAAASQFLSKITDVMHPAAKIAGAPYMVSTEAAPNLRSVAALVLMLDERYAQTDTAREWAWLEEFTTFTRKPSGSTRYFRARLLREANLLGAMPMKMREGMISPHAIKAMGVSEGDLTIALSGLETKPNSDMVESL